MKARIVSIVLLVAVIVWETLQWSKCPISQCKVCNHKGCRKCKDRVLDFNYNCVDPVRSLDFCVREVNETVAGNLVPRCNQCATGLYVNEARTSCISIGDGDCYAGEVNTVRF